MAKRKSKGPPTVMKEDDVAYRRRLLANWGYACIICGLEFANLACVTKEHIIPKSKVKKGTLGNIAPSHHRCNKLRGVESILATCKHIHMLKSTMRHVEFQEWLNAPVPNRIVPASALQPIRRILLSCFELPEHLPGL